MGPFLAYSDDNSISFFDNNGEENYWIRYYKIILEQKRYQAIKTFYQKDIIEKINKENRNLKSNRFYLIKTKWNQDFPYNKLVIHDNDNKCYEPQFSSYNHFCPAGCVAVAVAQLMRYWKFPYLQYDWCNMPAEITAQSLTEQVDAIARLIADVGNAVEMEYCNGGCNSSASDTKAEKALKETFNYHESIDIIRKGWYSANNWKNIIHNQLDNSQPVYYSGCKTATNCGHAFICDGYDFDDPDFFHFNFGWGGNSDGFYYMFDDDGEDSLQNYHHYQHAIINIKPSYNYYCNSIFTVKEEYQHDMFNQIKYYNPMFGTIQTAYFPSNVLISSGEHVHYMAHNEIILNDGFVADFGSEFIAENVPCPALCDVETPTNKTEMQHDMFNQIRSADLNFEVRIYPNPFTNFLVIENLNELNIKEISIYNALGVEVYKNKLNSNSFTIETSSFEKGIYLIKISDRNRILYKKIMKIN